MARKKLKRVRNHTTQKYTTIIVTAGVFIICIASYTKLHSPTPAVTANVQSSKTTDSNYIFLPVPTRDIAAGEKLSSIPFSHVRWPVGPTTAHFITDISDLGENKATTILPAGIPIFQKSVSSETVDINAVVESIPQGMRAITVRVDIESSVEGWARSGNYVDVIVLRPSQNSDAGLETKVIAENVRILSAGRSVAPALKDQATSQAPGTVTLLVSQQDALRIKTGSSIGRLTFSLRGHGDTSPTINRTLNQRDLLFGTDNPHPKEIRYLGRAKGPDGQNYILTDNSQWLKASEQAASSDAAINVSNEPFANEYNY